MYKFDSICDFVSGMYFSLDLVLAIYLLHSGLRRAGGTVPSILLASFAMLLDSGAVLLHAIRRIYMIHAAIFFYLLPLADLTITSMLLLAGFSLLSSRYPSRKSLFAVLATSFVIYLIYVFTGSMNLFSVLTILWLVLIFTATVVRVRRFNEQLTFFYSNVDKHRTTWFVYILVWAFAVYPIYKFSNVSVAYSDLLYALYSLSTMAMYTIVAFKLVDQTTNASSAFYEISEMKKIEDPGQFLPKTESNRRSADDYFTAEQKQDMMRRLVALMEADKLYRSQDLCVDELVKRLNTNASYFYYFMRDVAKSPFLDFVNSYRVEESKAMLLQGEKVEYIVRKVGFNSDNTFRRAFKKATGFTPSEWRQSQGK